jgi:hypothetical protein
VLGAIWTPALRWSWHYAAGGETGTDPISAGSRFSTNDGELRWIQAAIEEAVNYRIGIELSRFVIVASCLEFTVRLGGCRTTELDQ